MSLLYPFDFPCQLKNWLRVQGVALKLYCFGQRVPLCSSRSQPLDCRSLLNLLLLLLLLDATGFRASLPLTRKNMNPFVALEKSTLRRDVGFPGSYRHPRTFRCNRTRCGGRTCRNKKQKMHRCLSRLGHNPFFFFLILYPLRHCGAAYQAEILCAASGAEMEILSE